MKIHVIGACIALALLAGCASAVITKQKVGYLDENGQVKVKEVEIVTRMPVRPPDKAPESISGLFGH